MSSKIVRTGVRPLRLIKNGVNKLVDAVSVTLGPKGKTVLIHRGLGSPHITKDGVTVAKEVEFEDSVMNMAARITKQVSAKTAELVGDGTSTSSILINSIFNHGYDLLVRTTKSWWDFWGTGREEFTGINPNKLKEGIEWAKGDVIDKLKSFAVQVDSHEELNSIATVSCNNDKVMGGLISEVYEKLGNSAKVIRNPDPSTTGKDEVEISEGYTFQKGFASPSFGDKKGNTISELENPIFGLFPKELSDFNEVMPFLELSFVTKRPVVIIAHEFEPRLLELLVRNNLSPQSSKILAIKTPGLGEARYNNLSDIAAVLNYDITSINPKALKGEELGKCIRITSNAMETTLVLPSEGENKLLVSHIDSLENIISKSTDNKLVDAVKGRVSQMQGKVGIIHLHAQTEGELLERIDRLDDAIESTKAALDEGYIAGGGIVLYRLSELMNINLRDLERLHPNMDKESHLGYVTLLNALKTPFETIIRNCGLDPEDVISDLNRDLYYYSDKSISRMTFSYNPLTGKNCQMIINGIIDPVKVTRLALENAVSASCALLTTGCTISLN